MPHAPHAALLIDFDNVTLGIRSDLTKELKNLLNSDIIKGKVAVQRAYADWRRYPQYIVPLSESSIDLIFAPAFGTAKKNATDIRLAIDAVELIFTRPEIGTFIIMSGDSDFSAMVIKLKEYGKYVVGVGIRESASDLLIQNCDEYYSYSDLAGLTKEGDTPSIQRDPWELVSEAVSRMVQHGDVMRSDRLKQVMQQIDSNFDESNAGFNRFSKFVTEAANRGLLQLTRMENGQYEIAAPAGAAAPAAAAKPARGSSRPAEPAAREERTGARRRGRRGRGREREGAATPAETQAAPVEAKPSNGLTLARAFQLMTEALGEFRGPVGHEQLRSRMAAMNGKEDDLLDPDRFPRLLRQANDAEIADVRTSGENEFEVSLRHRPSYRSPDTTSASKAADENGAAAVQESPEAAPSPTRRGVRFRRGSRAPLRPAEIPLIGVVLSAESARRAEPAAAVVPAAGNPEAAKPAASKPAGRAKGAGRATKATKSAKATKATKAAKATATPAAPAEPGAPAKPAARGRTRTRAKKATAPKVAPSTSEGAVK